MNKPASLLLLITSIFLISCSNNKPAETQQNQNQFTGAKGEVRLMTLDPGHFHAALVQKYMYEQIDPVVHVYAPESDDVKNYLDNIKGFNSREDNPTSWEEIVYTGDDYFEKLLAEKPGNVMVTSGNNAKKTEYILKGLEADINMLADKPLVITPEQYPMLEKAFQLAQEKNLLLLDIMLLRYDAANNIQRELSKIPGIFGELQQGSLEKPAITSESVHHFFKYIAGNPIKRPAWFFDASQQGDGVVDITTHLVDLVQWEAFPEVVLKKEDVEMLSAKHWTTSLTKDMFKKVTQLEEYPAYLQKYVEDDVLKPYSNGEINYKLKGSHARVSVVWNFAAPEGTEDTYNSSICGTKCNIIIKQDKEENYQSHLYIKANVDDDLEEINSALEEAVNNQLASQYPGIALERLDNKLWTVHIPAKYKVGNEPYFKAYTENFLQYLASGNLPEWEIPNMLVKYYITTEALKMAQNN